VMGTTRKNGGDAENWSLNFQGWFRAHGPVEKEIFAAFRTEKRAASLLNAIPQVLRGVFACTLLFR